MDIGWAVRGRAKYGNFAFIRSQRVARPLSPLPSQRKTRTIAIRVAIYQAREREMRQASLLATEAEQGQDGEGGVAALPVPCIIKLRYEARLIR